MAKLPVAGGVKTRLARKIGVARATGFARHAAAALLQRVGCDRRWQTILAVAPDYGVHSRAWPTAPLLCSYCAGPSPVSITTSLEPVLTTAVLKGAVGFSLSM